MVAPKRFEFSFRDAAIFNAERVCLVAGIDKLDELHIARTLVIRWNEGWSSQAFDLVAVSVCLLTEPQRIVLGLGVDGRVARWGPVGFFTECIDADTAGLAAMGAMREIRVIGQRAYAVGMGRTAYRRDGIDDWTRIDAGVRANPSPASGKGFNSIDGFDEDEIYAVGWDGELWQYDGRDWIQHSLPTKLALQKVVCGQDGIVYAVGQGGLVLRGRHDAWEVIDHALTAETFWGACWFQDKLYASTSHGIFALHDGQLSTLDPGKFNKFGKAAANAFYRLAAHEDCIWSVGEKQLIRSTDGINWTELPYA